MGSLTADEEGKLRGRSLFDVHNHLQDDPENIKSIGELTTRYVCVMGTREEDWETVAKIYYEFPDKVIPAFGIHPYFAHKYSSDAVQKLEKWLVQIPIAIVGEIGLDKKAKTPETGRCEFEKQVEIFKVQLDLACQLNRPVSVHCVKAQGFLFELFRKSTELPPAIMMHSYAGSKETVDGLLKLPNQFGDRFFFSFSQAINMRSPKTVDVIKHIPQDRLLLESDHHKPNALDLSMLTICNIAAQARACPLRQLAKITFRNSCRIFGKC